MAASSIKNPSVEVCAMPYPFQGILQGGQTIVLPYTPAQLAIGCPSLANALVVTDLGDYSGATDEATYGPTSEDEGRFATLNVSPAAQSSGVRTIVEVIGDSDTGVTASTEQTDVYFDLGRTVTWATGALADQRFFRIDAPTIAFTGASTVTNASTMYIRGAPLAGANATLTNSYALFVDGGRCLINGVLALNAAPAVYADTQTGAGPTVSRPAGVVRVASGATDVTVTNTLVTATSLIFCEIRNTTTNSTSVQSVVPGSGSFVITLTADPGASHADIAFLVIDPSTGV